MQLLWLTLLAVHTALAGLWWWLMPHGFPSDATQYWVNEVIPVIVVILMVTALAARGRLSEAILPPVLLMIPLFWMAASIAARIVFIDSFESGWSPFFIGGAIIVGLWVRHFRYRLRPKWLVVPFALSAIGAGWAFPGTQRAPDPATSPKGESFGAAPTGNDHKVIKLLHDAQMRPDDGRLVVKRDKVILNVMPMLSFADRSPDRCFIAYAPPGASRPTSRIFEAKSHDGGHWSLWYKDEDHSVVDVSVDKDGAIVLDARSRLPQPIFSHVNSAAELAIKGHQKLSIAFSPAAQKRLEVPSVKANARFAYVDDAGTFHVVEADKGRRGPFTELAAGPLRAGEPLTMTFYDGAKPVFAVTLQDWAAQASLQLSPTAGSGVPANAIEFARGGDAETAPVVVTASLAATAVGQGTATVGHAAGVYRDRITVALPF